MEAEETQEIRFESASTKGALETSRRRLVRYGAPELTSTELLSVLLGSRGDPERSWRLAEQLTRRHGLRGLARFPVERWIDTGGLGPAAAARLAAAFELGRRAAGEEAPRPRPPVHTPRLAFQQVRDLGRRRREHLVGLYLDAQSRLIHRETISIGGLNTTRAHPREFLRPAIEHLAAAFILAHNHPSGSTDPSAEDVDFTRSAQTAAALMGFELFDHLIVTGDRYTSLRERGVFDADP